MAVSLNEFLVELYREYLEEASFLYEQRLTLFDDPEITWLEIEDFEDRFEPHIDGLVVGGDLALAVCSEQAEGGDFGELHAAVRVFCRQRREDLLDQVLAGLDVEDDEKVQAVIDALEHELPDEWQNKFIAMLSDPSQGQVRIAANVLGYRRISAGEELIHALADESSPALPSLIWAIGRIREKAAGPGLLGCMTNGDEAIRPAAALALIRSGEPQAVRECAYRVVSEDWPLLPLALSGPESIARTLLGLGSDRSGPEWCLALGLLGAVAAVEPLLSLLPDEALGEYAVMGLNLITGADLYETAFIPEEIDEDELFEEELEKVRKGEALYPPGEAPGTTITALSREPSAWQAWWRGNQKRFQPGIRYRGGRPCSPACLVDSLASERSPRLIRQLAYEELVIRYNIDHPFESDMRVADQKQTLRRYDRWNEAHARTFQDGRWYFNGNILR
jgi:uncharacterized protein (TIGR02270 family)